MNYTSELSLRCSTVASLSRCNSAKFGTFIEIIGHYP